MNASRLARLQEAAINKGKTLLIEEFGYAVPANQVEAFFEDFGKNGKLIEGRVGATWNARGRLRDVPVTRFTENKNRRIYPRELWENVHRSGLFEGAFCLSDHAETEGSTSRIVGIWHNFRVMEEQCIADLYLVGDLGQLLLEAVRAGARGAGFSTVGFGSIGRDGKTVLPEDYELSEESACDWVLLPSQAVYGTLANYDEAFLSKKESVIQTAKSVVIEKGSGRTQMDKIDVLLLTEQNHLKNKVKRIVKENKKAIIEKNHDSVQDTKNELKEILQTTHSEILIKEIRESVEIAISETEQALVEMLNEKKGIVESTGKEVVALREKLAALEKQYTSLATKHTNAVELIGRFQKDTDEYKKMEADAKVLEKDTYRLLQEKNMAESEVVRLEKSYEQHEIDVKALESIKETLEAKVVRQEKLLAIFKSRYESVREEADGLRERLERFQTESGKRPVRENQMWKCACPSNNMHPDSEKECGGCGKKMGESHRPMLRKPIRREMGAPSSVEKKRGYEDYAGNEKDSAVAVDPAIELQFQNDDDSVKIAEGVLDLYNDEVRKTPGISAIKERILKSQSVLEAVERIEGFKENPAVSSAVKLEESTKKPLDDYPSGNWMGGRA